MAASAVLAVLATFGAACDDAPPARPEGAQNAATSPDGVTEPVAIRAPGHPYLAAYRSEMMRVLRPDQAAQLTAVDAAGTESRDGRQLAFVATDRVVRGVLPLVVDAVGMQAEARRLRALEPIDTAASAARAQRLLPRVVARAEREVRAVEEPPFPGRRTLRAARIVQDIVEPMADESADAEPPNAAHAERVVAVFALLFEAYRTPEEMAIVEPLPVDLFRDMVAAPVDAAEPAQ